MNNLLLYYEATFTQNDPEGAMARRWFNRFERIIGFRPFNVHYPLDSDVPKLRLSRIGLLALVLQIFIFFISNIVLIMTDPHNEYANNDEVSDMAYTAIEIMYLLNSVFIFSLV